MLQRPASPSFLDRKHEWCRLFAEAWGTFLLALVAAGGGVVAARSGHAVSLAMIVVAPGFMVMAIMYFMGTMSTVHLNPAWVYVAGRLLGAMSDDPVTANSASILGVASDETSHRRLQFRLH
ncbi:MAG: hypothetical protein ACOH2R_04565 [Pseudomonas sp.]